MPIKVQSGLPARETLERENVFTMDENRAVHQDIRPIEVGILNLMPLKEDVTFVVVSSHESRNTSSSHLNKFYNTFSEIRERKFDGFIITGAPVEQMEYDQVDYWKEFQEICEWTKTNVTSTMHLCWGAQAGLYHH